MYEKFPTPLINRLEKHFVLTSSILEDWQEQVLKDFEEWIRNFSDTGYDIKQGDACFTVKHNHLLLGKWFISIRTMLLGHVALPLGWDCG